MIDPVFRSPACPRVDRAARVRTTAHLFPLPLPRGHAGLQWRGRSSGSGVIRRRAPSHELLARSGTAALRRRPLQRRGRPGFAPGSLFRLRAARGRDREVPCLVVFSHKYIPSGSQVKARRTVRLATVPALPDRHQALTSTNVFSKTRLCFVRHGRAIGVEGRCIGQTDVALSTAGEQAIRDLVSGIGMRAAHTVVFSSDLQRARASARIIATTLGCDVGCDPRLREAHFGVWDGRLWDDIEHSDSARFYAWMDRWAEIAPPGGEAVTDIRCRAVAWIDEVLAATVTGHRTLFVVSHAGWIRLAVGYLLGRPIATMFEVPIDHAAATIVDVHGTERSLVASNVRRLSPLLASDGGPI